MYFKVEIFVSSSMGQLDLYNKGLCNLHSSSKPLSIAEMLLLRQSSLIRPSQSSLVPSVGASPGLLAGALPVPRWQAIGRLSKRPLLHGAGGAGSSAIDGGAARGAADSAGSGHRSAAVHSFPAAAWRHSVAAQHHRHARAEWFCGRRGRNETVDRSKPPNTAKMLALCS